MTASRRFGIFVIAFAIAYPIIYIAATELNLAAFTYHSALGEFGLGPNKPRNGPAMYWFGWITTSAIGALVVATIAAYLPSRLTEKLSMTAAWVVPLLAMVTAGGLMVRLYFFR
jgi:hypothetical protein